MNQHVLTIVCKGEKVNILLRVGYRSIKISFSPLPWYSQPVPGHECYPWSSWSIIHRPLKAN